MYVMFVGIAYLEWSNIYSLNAFSYYTYTLILSLIHFAVNNIWICDLTFLGTADKKWMNWKRTFFLCLKSEEHEFEKKYCELLSSQFDVKSKSKSKTRSELLLQICILTFNFYVTDSSNTSLPLNSKECRKNAEVKYFFFENYEKEIRYFLNSYPSP
jgi:hypothetical protein